jgi:hypothetical protein
MKSELARKPFPPQGGSVAAFYHPAFERPGLENETSARHWREFFACCDVVMLRMSFSWWYTLSTPSMEGAGNVSRTAAATVIFWLALAKTGHCTPSRLMVAATSLVQAQVLVSAIPPPLTSPTIKPI